MGIPRNEAEGSKSLLDQITTAILSNPVGKWLAFAAAASLLVLAFRLKDFKYNDWVVEFDRSTAAFLPSLAAGPAPGGGRGH